MIRRMTVLSVLPLALLLGGTAHAASLYKWVEVDGSITFSPNPPPAGTDFERVGEPSPRTELPADAIIAPKPDAAVAQAAGTPAQPTPASVEQAQAATPDPVVDTSVSYAPPPLGAAVDSSVGIAAGDPTTADATPEEATGNTTGRTSVADAAPISERDARCRELAKRVVSLERRLGTRLSPEDMDNTVLYMARYQQNVDRHCSG